MHSEETDQKGQSQGRTALLTKGDSGESTDLTSKEFRCQACHELSCKTAGDGASLSAQVPFCKKDPLGPPGRPRSGIPDATMLGLETHCKT